MTNTLVGFERLARPLLELIQHLSGLETSFVSDASIDFPASFGGV